jgi:hypothetical protein
MTVIFGKVEGDDVVDSVLEIKLRFWPEDCDLVETSPINFLRNTHTRTHLRTHIHTHTHSHTYTYTHTLGALEGGHIMSSVHQPPATDPNNGRTATPLSPIPWWIFLQICSAG